MVALGTCFMEMSVQLLFSEKVNRGSFLIFSCTDIHRLSSVRVSIHSHVIIILQSTPLPDGSAQQCFGQLAQY